MYCKSCGKEFNDEARFCKYCGFDNAKIKEAMSSPNKEKGDLATENLTTTSEEPKKKSNCVIRIVAIIVFIISLLVAKFIVSSILNSGRSSVAGNRYPASEEQAFMDNCLQSAGSESYRNYCNCTLDYLEKNVSYDDMKTIAQNYQTTKVMPSQMQNAANSCKGSINK